MTKYRTITINNDLYQMIHKISEAEQRTKMKVVQRAIDLYIKKKLEDKE